MRTIKLLLAVLFSVALASCGGGGGTTTGGGTPAGSTVTGTAATGLPVANASLVFKGANGQQVTATTSATGAYSLSTGSLTSPYFVKVTTAAATLNYPAGSVFYSVSADAAPSVVNVTPLTDLVVRSWYQVQPTPVTADVAFANPVANPPPAPGVVTVIENVVRQIVGNLLNSNGVNPATLNLISTPFVANGAGVDAALDATQVNAASGIVMTGALTTTITAASGVISTTAVSGVNSTSTSVPIPTNANASVVTGIQTGLDTFAAAVNAKGTQLADTDILPFLDANNAMIGGFTPAETAAEYAGTMRVQTAGDTVSMKVVSLDSVAGNVAHVTVLFTKTTNGKPGTQPVQFALVQQANGQWLDARDMRFADVDGSVITSTYAGSVGTNQTNINIDVAALLPPGGATLTGILTGIPTVSGPGLSSTPLIAGGTNTASYIAKPGAAPVNVTYDTFHFPTNILPPLAAGNVYTVSLPTATSSVSSTVTSNAVTTEAISIGGLTIGLSNAKLGTPLTFSWTLPTTFTVIGVALEGNSTNGANRCGIINGSVLLPATATSGTVTLPATCGGVAATGAWVAVDIYGAHGERILAQFTF